MSYEAETKRLGDFGYRERLDKLTETVTELIEMARIDHQTLRNILTRVEALERFRSEVTPQISRQAMTTAGHCDDLDRLAGWDAELAGRIDTVAEAAGLDVVVWQATEESDIKDSITRGSTGALGR